MLCFELVKFDRTKHSSGICWVDGLMYFSHGTVCYISVSLIQIIWGARHPLIYLFLLFCLAHGHQQIFIGYIGRNMNLHWRSAVPGTLLGRVEVIL